VILVGGVLAALIAGDIPAMATIALVTGVTLAFSVAGEQVEPESQAADAALLPTDVSLGDVDVRPGNVLVAVRHAHALAHLSAAIQAAPDRDVVVMTVRLLGVDVDEDAPNDIGVTNDERHLFAEVVALTERLGRPVRLLIVPAHNIFDAAVA